MFWFPAFSRLSVASRLCNICVCVLLIIQVAECIFFFFPSHHGHPMTHCEHMCFTDTKHVSPSKDENDPAHVFINGSLFTAWKQLIRFSPATRPVLRHSKAFRLDHTLQQWCDRRSFSYASLCLELLPCQRNRALSFMSPQPSKRWNVTRMPRERNLLGKWQFRAFNDKLIWLRFICWMLEDAVPVYPEITWEIKAILCDPEREILRGFKNCLNFPEEGKILEGWIQPSPSLHACAAS